MGFQSKTISIICSEMYLCLTQLIDANPNSLEHNESFSNLPSLRPGSSASKSSWNSVSFPGARIVGGDPKHFHPNYLAVVGVNRGNNSVIISL